jgi:hypothetical protein
MRGRTGQTDMFTGDRMIPLSSAKGGKGGAADLQEILFPADSGLGVWS